MLFVNEITNHQSKLSFERRRQLEKLRHKITGEE